MITKNSISEIDDPLSFSVFIDTKHHQLSSSPPDRDILSTNLNKIYPKETKKWIDSGMILNCQICSSKFGYVIRKHHCRACGGVFCGTCCSKYISIPQKYIHVPKEDDSYYQLVTNLTKLVIEKTITGEIQGDLVCDDCYTKISNLRMLTKHLEISEIVTPLIFSFLDIKSSINCLYVSKSWYNVGIHYLSKFRAIQYIYDNRLYTKWEKDMLLSSKQMLEGHSCWTVPLIKSVLQHYYVTGINEIHKIKQCVYNRQKNKSCLFTMCSRKCGVSLDMLDFLDILKFVIELEKNQHIIKSNKIIRCFILEIFKKMMGVTEPSYVTIRTIPLFCSVLIELNDLSLTSELITESLKYDKLVLEIYLEYHYLAQVSKLGIKMQNFTKTVRNCFESYNYSVKSESIRLTQSMNFTNSKICSSPTFDGMYNSTASLTTISFMTLQEGLEQDLDKLNEFVLDIIEEKKINLITVPVIYPFNFDFNIVEVISIRKIESKTKPYEVEMVLSHKLGKSANIKKKLIIKKDKDLRKESIISRLMSLLQYKLYQQVGKKSLKTFEHVPTYQILMLTEDIGIIEFVENSITLRKINNLGLTLQNYILQQNPTEIVDNIKMRFAQSLAISSCLSYILGLGDRHLDNIMINSKGQIFHIDYGYLMDNPMMSVLTASNIKITSVMVDFLGGMDSKYYQEFKKYTIQVYDIMRLYSNSIVNHYEMIGNEKFIIWSTFKDKLESRFMNGVTCKDVQLILLNEIDSSMTYGSALEETCQNIKQQVLMWMKKK
jgi:hypothetical protein